MPLDRHQLSMGTVVQGTGGPSSLRLDAWCVLVNLGFGPCYLVGSATRGKQWRDVDVVCIMDDDHFAEVFGHVDGIRQSMNPRWAASCAAFSQWASEATGLPVDFKFQGATHANERHDGPRIALGLYLGLTDGG